MLLKITTYLTNLPMYVKNLRTSRHLVNLFFIMMLHNEYIPISPKKFVAKLERSLKARLKVKKGNWKKLN